MKLSNHAVKAFLLALALISINASSEEQKTSYSNEPKNGQYLVVLEPKMKTLISAEVMSPVTKVNKKMGDRVQEGELILKLDDTIYAANFQKAEMNLSKATVELEITRRLFEDKSASLFDLKSAEAQLAQANSEYWQGKKLLDSTTIRAPYNGKVVKVYLDEYELSQPGKELVEIVDDSKLYARFLAPATTLSALKAGGALVMRIDGVPGDIQASINRISPVIEAVSGTIKVEAEIDNRDDLMMAGMVGLISLGPRLESSKEEELPEIKPSKGRASPPLTRPLKNSSDQGIAL